MVGRLLSDKGIMDWPGLVKVNGEGGGLLRWRAAESIPLFGIVRHIVCNCISYTASLGLLQYALLEHNDFRL